MGPESRGGDKSGPTCRESAAAKQAAGVCLRQIAPFIWRRLSFQLGQINWALGETERQLEEKPLFARSPFG